MRITIAERLRPFSHLPGAYFVLPGSTLRFQIFPALIRVCDLSHSEPRLISEIPLNVKGPVHNFTVLQDLEKSRLCVWGHTQAGYMHYCIYASGPKDFLIKVDKQPSEIFVPVPMPMPVPDLIKERLSLGNHKAQDWSLISRRCNFEEIFPLWMRLGLLTPSIPSHSEGTASLLDPCSKAIMEQNKDAVLPAFNLLFKAGFDSGLSPRLSDTEHQGISVQALKSNSSASPLLLLTEGAQLIRQLFIQQNEAQISILPVLPTEFHCGRFINFPCKNVGILDIEWSKKLIRRMLLSASHDGCITAIFQNPIKRFRLRCDEQDKGTMLPIGTSIPLSAGKNYLFDHFEK